jgi:hypothetical protein
VSIKTSVPVAESQEQLKTGASHEFDPIITVNVVKVKNGWFIARGLEICALDSEL